MVRQNIEAGRRGQTPSGNCNHSSRGDDEYVVAKTLEGLQAGERVALCTLVKKAGSAPRDVGAKMVVFEDGRTCGTVGGGEFERLVVRKAVETLNSGRSTSADFSFGGGKGVADSIDTGLICGGTATVFMDILRPSPRLVIIGGGHIGFPLARLAETLGFKMCIIDDNKHMVNRERFPMADELIVDERFDHALERARLSTSDLVAIVHGDVDRDFQALATAAKSDVRYIGLLGSKRKISEFMKRLRREGVKPGRLKGRLFAPIGLDIGAETPGEIALSIIAQVVQSLRKGKRPHKTHPR
ncbi:MAG: XdhC family protein [Nitrososphaeria archaeon]